MKEENIENICKILKVNGWGDIFNKDSIKEINTNLSSISRNFEDGNYVLLPMKSKFSGIFRAFELTPLKAVKVIIFGQDPYPNENRADGLAFSFKNAKEKPNNSLNNIFKQLNDLNIKTEKTNLTDWANEGVLLLNTSLTFGKLKNSTKSNQNKIQQQHIELWKPYISKIVDKLLSVERSQKEPLVIMLWGGYANLLEQFRNDAQDNDYKKRNIYVLRSSHPSNIGGTAKKYNGKFKSTAKQLKCKPLNNEVCAFMNGKHFEKCNRILGNNKINWNLIISSN